MNNNKPTNELRGFYSAYSAWAQGGAQAGTIFRRTHGLCACAYDYFSAIGVDVESPLEAMHEAFTAAGLKEKLPFNENPDHYREEQARSECHLNPARMAWVAAELQEYRNAAEPVGIFAKRGDTWLELCPGDTFEHPDAVRLYAAPQPLTDAERAELQEYRNAQQVVPSKPTESDIPSWLNGEKRLHWLSGAEWMHKTFCAAMQSGAVKDGWVAVPVDPTESMVIAGFESEPDEFFSKAEEWEAYQNMSGCSQAAHRVKLCWAAMLAVAPQPSESVAHSRGDLDEPSTR